MAKAKQSSSGFSGLCPRAWATSLGILCGIDCFLLIALPLLGINVLWWNPNTLTWFIMPGMSLSWVGSLVGLFWGVIIGAVFGWLLAVVHNWALKKYSCR